MDSCTPVRRILILACLAVPGHAMVGCTVIPQAEFETYRFAFAEARLSGEAMLTDHAAAREDFHRPRPGLAGLNGQIAMAQLQLGLAAAGVPGEDIAALKTQITEARSRIEEAEDDLGAFSMFALDVREASTGLSAEEIIGIRFKAWDVIGHYNDVLSGLATGVPEEQMQGSVINLLDSIRGLPSSFESVMGAAEAMVPYAEGIAFLLDQLQGEVERRRFKEAILAAAPLIDGLIEEVMFPDAQDFYDIRLALYFLDTVSPTFEIAELGSSYRHLAAPFADDRDCVGLTSAINDAWKLLPTYDPAENTVTFPEGSGGSIPEAGDLAQMQELRTLIVTLAEEVDTEHARFMAYRDAMISYGRLLERFRAANLQLENAVRFDTKTAPSIEELIAIAAQTRRAFETYRNTR